MKNGDQNSELNFRIKFYSLNSIFPTKKIDFFLQENNKFVKKEFLLIASGDGCERGVGNIQHCSIFRGLVTSIPLLGFSRRNLWVMIPLSGYSQIEIVG